MKAGYVKRFSPVERLLHWVNAIGFFFLLATGLILYLPRLSELVSRRQFIQSIHFWGGVAWLGALIAVVLLGVRRLLATARELEQFDGDDLRWLRRRKAPQGRFNAGQKINAAVTAAFTILFGVSGFLLWFGEQDTRFRFASTVILHDGVMYTSLGLLVYLNFTDHEVRERDYFYTSAFQFFAIWIGMGLSFLIEWAHERWPVFAKRQVMATACVAAVALSLGPLGHYWFTIVELAPDTTRESEPV